MREPRKIRGVENRRRVRADGTVRWTFRVRHEDPATGQRRAEEYDRQADAIDRLAELRLARRRPGPLEDPRAAVTLAEHVEHWWDEHATRTLADATLRSYAGAWNRHALPRVGDVELRDLTPGRVATLRDELVRDGVGAPTIRVVMAMLQSMLRRAVEDDLIPANPVAQIRKPRLPARRAVRPLTPEAVEGIRRALTQPEHRAFVSVLAYAGLRPEEALALEWRHIRKATILVEQKVVDGRIETGQKTTRPPRTVDLADALRRELAELRLAAGRPGDGALVLPARDGAPWAADRYRNWRRRIFRPAAAAAGLACAPPWSAERPYDGPRPYDLRHSFASLLIHEGRLSVVEIAAQMGNDPTMTLGTYSHLFAEFRDQPKVSAADAIASARHLSRKVS